jgi:ATP/maltotriose-dependent transcriptional regulator MalT
VVLRSKFERPLPHPDAIYRSQLVDSLDVSDARPLRVILAPTGWGKSQLIAQWIDAHDGPVAYVALDPFDDDPSRCWTYILHAIAEALEIDLEDLVAALRAPALPLVTEIVEPLLVRIAERELLIVLENPGVLRDRLKVVERQLRLPPRTPTRPQRHALVEELSDREMALLRLLPGDLSQRELGQALHVSFNTIKTYNRQIYRKLNVSSRSDAVTTARAVGLL